MGRSAPRAPPFARPVVPGASATDQDRLRDSRRVATRVPSDHVADNSLIPELGWHLKRGLAALDPGSSNPDGAGAAIFASGGAINEVAADATAFVNATSSRCWRRKPPGLISPAGSAPTAGPTSSGWSRSRTAMTPTMYSASSRASRSTERSGRFVARRQALSAWRNSARHFAAARSAPERPRAGRRAPRNRRRRCWATGCGLPGSAARARAGSRRN